LKAYGVVVVPVEPVDVFEVSADILELVSIEEGATEVEESIVVVVLVLEVSELVASELALSLQAAKAPIAKTNKIFFMLNFLFVKKLYGLILKVGKRNPLYSKKINFILLPFQVLNLS
jgi:hypothetical protein